MNKLQKLLCIGTGALVLGFTSCKAGPIYETGTVIKERKIEPALIRINNTEITAGPKEYILQVKTDNGIYTMSVLEGCIKTIETLAEVIEEGKRVKFQIGYENIMGSKEKHFSNDLLGKVNADNIEVLKY